MCVAPAGCLEGATACLLLLLLEDPAGGLLFRQKGVVSAVSRVQREGVTHAKLRDNGGIRDRRGRAVVRPAGPGAG